MLSMRARDRSQPTRVYKILGHDMFLDEKDSLQLSVHGVYEPFQTELAVGLIKKGDVVLDIGANIGYYTLIFAREVGPQGRVYAFEPEPTNFAILKRNVEINGYENVIMVPKAVSNETGRIRLYLCEENWGDHRIYDSGDGREWIEVEAVRLDDYFDGYRGPVNFIKMDIQGAEAKALQGMAGLLERNRHLTMMTEFWPAGLKKCGTDPQEYLKSLVDHGFKVLHINEQSRRAEVVVVRNLLDLHAPERGSYTNLLCLRRR